MKSKKQQVDPEFLDHECETAEGEQCDFCGRRRMIREEIIELEFSDADLREYEKLVD